MREAAWPGAALLKTPYRGQGPHCPGAGLPPPLARLEKEKSQKTLLRLRDELAQASGQHIASSDELEIFPSKPSAPVRGRAE